MGKDKRGVLHGKCLICSECDEYETTSTTSILCEYCGHRPVEHEITRTTEEGTAAPLTAAKKRKLDLIEELPEFDLGDSEGLIEITEDDQGSVSNSPSLNSQEIVQAQISASSEKSQVSPCCATPDKEMEVIEVAADEDTELKVQQVKANELAKKEDAAFKIKRRQGKFFAE